MDAGLARLYDKVMGSPYFEFLLNNHGGRDTPEGDQWWDDIKNQFIATPDENAARTGNLGGLIQNAEAASKIASELGTREVSKVMDEFFKRNGKTAAAEDVDTLWDETE